MNSPELLMPAGNFEKLQYAFAYGADAVYAGIPMFSLRARENQFDVSKVEEGIQYAHKLGKKIYLTANIFAHNNKINVFMKALDQMVELQPDAFIMADPGLIMMARKRHPKINIHLSVQANNVNWAQAKFWYDYGVSRMILSRELSLAEISEIHKQVPQMELEAFVHGSICVAYSGRCLLSNYFMNRDANQGVCGHSCRWQYKVLKESEDANQLNELHVNYKTLQGNYFLEEKERPGQLLPIDEDEYGTYIMNSRDLCAIKLLPELLKAGVISLKTEGRNKTIYYLSVVTSIYRKAIDLLAQGAEIPDSFVDELSAVSNRGFIPGYLKGDIQDKGQAYDGQSYQTHYFAGIVRNYDDSKKIIRIDVKARMKKGDEIEIITPTGFRTQIINKMAYADEPDMLIDIVHGGHKDAVIWVDKVVPDFSLVRIKGIF